MFTNLKDINREILYKADDADILRICSVNKFAFEKVCDDNFFHNLLLRRYPKALQNHVLNSKINLYKLYKVLYINIVNTKEMIKKLSMEKYESEFNFTDGDVTLYYTFIADGKKETLPYAAAKHGLKDLLYYLLKLSSMNSINYNGLMEYVVKGNHFTVAEIKELFKDKDVSYSTGLFLSTLNKNREIVNYMIQKGANINYGLDGAVIIGDIPLIQEFIDKGATDLAGAILGIFESSPDSVEHDSKESGDKEQEKREDIAFNTLKFLVEKINNPLIMNEDVWDEIQVEAATKGYVKILQYAENHLPHNWNRPIFTAMTYKRWNIINYLIDTGFNDWEEAYNFAKDELEDPELTAFFSNYL